MRRTFFLLTLMAAILLACAGVVLAQQGGRTTPSEDSPSFGGQPEKRFAPDRIIVKLERGARSGALEELNRRNGASTIKEIPRSNFRVVKVPQGLSVEEAVQRYGGSPDVEYAEPDFLLQPANTTPNDPYYGQNKLWGLNNIGQDSGTNDADVDAPEAWDTTTGNSGTVVAVIDTGVQISHTDLKDNIWRNTREIAGNRKDDDNNGYKDDINGWDCRGNNNSVYDSSSYDKHGTHVAGTIAAKGNNGTGVAGVNWQAKIMVGKFLGPSGGYTSDAVECLLYAANNGAKISNNSWGGGGESQSLKDAITYADGKDHLFVAAASNEGEDNDSTPSYPSSYDNDNIISVAATDRNDALASFSNYGETKVDLAAPGVSILSTLPGTYGSYSGTSMATPHVAGVAALLKGKESYLEDTAIKTRILGSVDTKSALSGKMVSGGRLNANGALANTGSSTSSSS